MGTYSFLKDYSVPRLIFEIANAQTLDGNRLLKKFNLTVEQTYLLYHLSIESNVSQRDLSNKTFKDQANTTRILKRLLHKGLVEITGSETDKRVNIVCLSPEGERIFKKVSGCLDEAERRVYALFSNECSENLKKMLLEYLRVYTGSDEMVNWRRSNELL